MSSGRTSAVAPSPSTWCWPRRRPCRCPRAGPTSRRWAWWSAGRPRWPRSGRWAGAPPGRPARSRARRAPPARAPGGAPGQAAGTMAKHYGATVIAAAAAGKHEAVRVLGADHIIDSRGPDIAAEVRRLTGGVGAALGLESAGGDTFGASLAAAKRVTGRIVVYGLAGGEASISNWDLVYRRQVQLIGLNLGVLIQAAPQTFGEVMGELFRLIGAGVLAPGQPTVHELADGPKALAELEARATVGKLALRP